MAKVLGIGGIFFKSQNPTELQAWYQQHLNIEPDADGYVGFQWREKQNPDQEHMTVWSPFPHDTDYFDPTKASYMINYIVDDLDGILAQLRAAGATVDDKTMDESYGRFGWATDPDGVRFELWQPPAK
ncbi:MAG: VOC family protein [Chloroflexia bacterium]